MNQYIDAAWKYWKQRDQDGWIRGYGSPLCPANTSKILLHVKQFSLKTNWRLAKRVFYNQDCKKHPQTQSWVGKEKKKSGQDLCPKEMTERRRNTRVRRFYQGSEQFDSQARHPSFWSNTKTSSLLSWFENQWDWQRSSKKPRCDLWRAGTCLLLLKQGRGRSWSCLGLWQGLRGLSAFISTGPEHLLQALLFCGAALHLGEGCCSWEYA